MEKSEVTKEKDQLTEQVKEQKRLGNLISTVLKIENSFKLYTYRIIDLDSFQFEMENAIETYLKSIDVDEFMKRTKS